MADTKHTPGPWEVFPKESKLFVYCDNELGSRVADCTAIAPLTKEEQEANAKLIASAPDLLKELRLYVIQCACGFHADGVVKVSGCFRCASAVAIIAKATT